MSFFEENLSKLDGAFQAAANCATGSSCDGSMNHPDGCKAML